MRTRALLVTVLAVAGCMSATPDTTTPAVIENSGSTNAAAFRLNVSPGGSVAWHNEPARNIPNALGCSAVDGTTTLAPALITRLFDHLQSASVATGFHFDECPRSVSFGTRTTLTYGTSEFTSVDCGSASDELAASLAHDVQDVQTAVAAACH